MTSINTEKLKAGLKDYFDNPEVAAKIEEIKDANILKKLVVGLSLIPDLVAIVEEIATDIGDAVPGSDKRKVIVDFMDDVIKAPFWVEPFDDNIIGIAVDTVVLYYNTKIGHSWLAKVKSWFL